jgi:hypothetical protein
VNILSIIFANSLSLNEAMTRIPDWHALRTSGAQQASQHDARTPQSEPAGRLQQPARDGLEWQPEAGDGALHVSSLRRSCVLLPSGIVPVTVLTSGSGLVGPRARGVLRPGGNITTHAPGSDAAREAAREGNCKLASAAGQLDDGC